METSEQQVRDRSLEKIKLQLMMKPDTVFFTSILFSLVYNWDDSIATAAVDGKNLFMNPKFFDSLTANERMGVLVHEVLHVALNHITRGLQHDRTIGNYAADYVVNLIVIKAGFILPKDCLLDYKYANMSYEQVYKILLKESKKNPNKFNGNTPGTGQDILPPADKAEADSIEADVADIVFKATVATQKAGQAGSIPGTVLIELDKTYNPRLPWEVLFQNYMSTFAKEDYSYKKPNRRYLPELIVPTQYSEAVSNIVFAVDSSGSVSNAEFGFFIQEIETVHTQLHPEKITLINFDTKIKNIHEIDQDFADFNSIEFTGRGGTNVRDLFDWANKNDPEVLVIFTDGYFRQPNSSDYPNCPVLWVIHNNLNFSTKDGEVINYELI